MRYLFLLILFLWPQTTPRTARAYYDELYAAGGLDRMADGHVCFDEDSSLQTFFIYGESEVLKAFLELEDGFKNLPKGSRARFDKPFIMIHGYDKGVSVGERDYYDKDGVSWTSEKFKISNECCMRIRLTITPGTMRYKRSLEILNPSGSIRSEVSRYGKCEAVKPDVHQNGE